MPHHPRDLPGLHTDAPDEEGIEPASIEDDLELEPEEKPNRTDPTHDQRPKD